MKVIQVLVFSALAFGTCADDFRVAAEGGRAEIQRAIDAAAAAGGGRVVVAPGAHPIGSLRLRSHVELHLEKGAVLLGSTKRGDYDGFPRDVCSVSPESSYTALVQAWDAEDIAITGELRIVDVEVVEGGARIRVAAEAGGDGVDLSKANGVIYVATDKPRLSRCHPPSARLSRQ